MLHSGLLLYGSTDTILDLRNTSLENVDINGAIANIYFPKTIKYINLGNGGIPVIDTDSNNLITCRVAYPKGDMSLKNEFFNSLKNANNLSTLSIRRSINLNVSSLSEYLKDELPSVTTLELSGNDKNYPQQVLQNLNGIEKFTNLQNLIVTYTSKSLNISAIQNCSKLISVKIQNTNIQSLSGVEKLYNLQNLNLYDNNISSLKALENLTNLEELNLGNNTITDTSSYVDSDGSTRTYNNLEILGNLNKNGKLKKLYLAGNDNIINWLPLSSLKWDAKSGW